MDNFLSSRFAKKAMSKRNKERIQIMSVILSSKIDFYVSRINSGSLIKIESTENILNLGNESREIKKTHRELCEYSEIEIENLKTFCSSISPKNKDKIESFFNHPQINKLIKRVNHGKSTR